MKLNIQHVEQLFEELPSVKLDEWRRVDENTPAGVVKILVTNQEDAKLNGVYYDPKGEKSMSVELNHTAEMLDPRTFAVHAMQRTSAWAYRVEIKSMFTDEDDNQALITEICKVLYAQLQRIASAVENRQDLKADEGEYYARNLRDIADQFESLGEDEDRCDKYFNNILSDLYDIGDSRMEFADGTLQKFLWVN